MDYIVLDCFLLSSLLDENRTIFIMMVEKIRRLNGINRMCSGECVCGIMGGWNIISGLLAFGSFIIIKYFMLSKPLSYFICLVYIRIKS